MNSDKNYIEHLRQGRETQIKQKQERREQYKLNPKLCIQCNTPISFDNKRNKFCSKSCAATHNNKDRIISKKDVLTHCKNCGEKLNRTTRHQRKFCSTKCSSNYRKNKEIQKTLSKLDNNKKVGIKSLKRIIKEKYGNKCSICGLGETWQGKDIIHILDHIDGNSENNSLDNLRLVCPNCDSQLPTFKGRNIGNGRHNRKQRYKEGKSY